MKSDYIHISVILDRSGSMASIWDDIIGGFNAFLREQKKNKKPATLTLIQFDTQNSYEIIYHFKHLDEVKELNRNSYVPRAATPLLDAIGRGINDLDGTIQQMEENLRPEKIIFTIITDGMENSSSEFSKEQIKKMITEKEKNNWSFVYLSADLNAIQEAEHLGFYKDSVMGFDKDSIGVFNMISSFSEKVIKLRTMNRVNNKIVFEDSDRQKQDIEKRRKK